MSTTIKQSLKIEKKRIDQRSSFDLIKINENNSRVVYHDYKIQKKKRNEY